MYIINITSIGDKERSKNVGNDDFGFLSREILLFSEGPLSEVPR